MTSLKPTIRKETVDTMHLLLSIYYMRCSELYHRHLLCVSSEPSIYIWPVIPFPELKLLISHPQPTSKLHSLSKQTKMFPIAFKATDSTPIIQVAEVVCVCLCACVCVCIGDKRYQLLVLGTLLNNCAQLGTNISCSELL